MKPANFHRLADGEFEEAAAFYDDRQKGLGREFTADMKRAIDAIRKHPERYPTYGTTSARQYALRRFPYVVYYIPQCDRIWVICISHAKRRPGYWLDRIPR